MNLDHAPLIVTWETTQACDQGCASCRLSADPYRNPAELTTEEGYRLLEEIHDFGAPLLVFSGGDPLKRPDLTSLLRRSVALGLRTQISPSASPLLTRRAIQELQQTGVQRMSLTLDGPNAWMHDGFRGLPGAYDRAIDALEDARLLGLQTEVRTTVTRRNLHALDQIADVVATVEAQAWSLYFPVRDGGGAGEGLIADEYEQIFEQLYQVSGWAPFAVETNEAAHYRRFVTRRNQQEGLANAEPWTGAAASDGRGSLFISHTGEIHPSGFLPVSAGNVRRDSLVEVYRNSSLFRILRDYRGREGKCGFCEYTKLCGGSRARAFAATGDYLAEDPGCVYEPSVTAAARRNSRPVLVQ